ncbi:FAEL328Wp [Eremothecium gossypii FDAG1]|nr:FAEL328Wp [Eremothecium gossypii FDAG1]
MAADGDPIALHTISDDVLAAKLARYKKLMNNFATLSQATKLEKVINRDHRETEQELQEIIEESQTRDNQEIRKLELRRTNLTSSLGKFHATLEQLSGSSESARQISARIRMIERERTLVHKTLQFIEQCRKLKYSISVVSSALEKNDHRLAANTIEKIRTLPPEVVESEFANRVVPCSEIPEQPAQLLKDWTSRLSEVFTEQFQHAAKAQDVEQLTSYFELFPKIGYAELGLEVYSKYVCDIIAGQSRKIMTGSTERRHMFYSKALLHLFKTVSTIINSHSQVISGCYGAKYMVHIMDKVQKEADLQAGIIWDTFMDVRRIEYLLAEIREWHEAQAQANKNHLHGAKPNSRPPPSSINELTMLISEYSAIFQHWSMYCRFFALKWDEFSQNTATELELPSIISEGKFSAKVTDSMSGFEQLVRHQLYRSFANAVDLEELPSLNDYLGPTPYDHEDLSSYPISSILEDLVLLIRVNLIATVNTGQKALLYKFSEALMRFIQTEFLIKVLQSRFKNIQPRLNPSLVLKKYLPSSDPTSVGMRSLSPKPVTQDTGKLSQFGFNFKSAATSTLTNLQSNIQSVYTDEESVLKLHHFLICVNTLSIGEVFFKRLLITEILEDQPQLLHSNFPFGRDATDVESVLRTLFGNIQTQGGKLLKWSLLQLFENMLKGKLKRLVAPMFVSGTDQEYICTAHDFENLSTLNLFLTQWKELILPFSNVLYKTAYIELISQMIDYLCEALEEKIWGIQCNELGGLKLDRELSLMITSLCGQHYFLREKFTRLSQLVLVLGLDDDDFDPATGDIKEETLSSINWILSAPERVRARNMRVDKRS